MTDRFELADLKEKTKAPVCEAQELAPDLNPICSFCHKPSHVVDFMLLGSYAAVCGQCIRDHAMFLDQHEAQQAKGEIDAVEVHGHGEKRETE